MSSWRNEAGFLMVSLVSFLPIVLAVTGGLVALAVVLYGERIVSHVCRNEIWTAQALYAQDLNQLISMNREAWRLAAEQKPALVAAKTIVGAAWAASVQARIAAFTAKQSHVLLKLQSRSQTHLHTIPQKMRHFLVSKRFAGEAISGSPFALPHPGVMARPLSPGLQTYHTVPALERLQTYRVAWTLRPDQLLKTFLPSRFLTQKRTLQIQNTCAATVYEKGGLWHPALIRAKWSSKW